MSSASDFNESKQKIGIMKAKPKCFLNSSDELLVLLQAYSPRVLYQHPLLYSVFCWTTSLRRGMAEGGTFPAWCPCRQQGAQGDTALQKASGH